MTGPMSPLFAISPALPLHTAGPYVAAAYIVFVLIILVYVGIMGLRLVRNQRDLVELRRELEQQEESLRGRNSSGSSAGAELPEEPPSEDVPVTDLSGQL